MHVCICMCLYICTCAHARVHTRTCVCKCACVCVHVCNFPNGRVFQVICDLQRSWPYFLQCSGLASCVGSLLSELFPSFHFLLLLKHLFWLFPRKGFTGSTSLGSCRFKTVFALSSYLTESSTEYKVLDEK